MNFSHQPNRAFTVSTRSTPVTSTEHDVLAALAAVNLDERPLTEWLTVLVRLGMDLMSSAVDAALTVVVDGRIHATVFAGSLGAFLDERPYPPSFGPAVGVSATDIPLLLTAAGDEHGRYRGYMAVARRHTVEQVLVVPLDSTGPMRGVLTFYRSDSTPYPADVLNTVTEFARRVGVMLGNLWKYHAALDEAAGLQEAMRSRAVIEQAKGMLMATVGCSSEEAFALLRTESQNRNIKLRLAAQQLVDRAPFLSQRGRSASAPTAGRQLAG